MNPTRVSDLGLVNVIFSEAVVTGPYFDSVGVLTWGIGHTAAAGPPDPRKFQMGQVATLDEILDVYKKDIRLYEKRTAKAMTGHTTQNEFDAGFSFDLNTGAIDRAAWVKSHNTGNKVSAGAQMMNWVKPPELLGRRTRERRLYEKGVYESQGRVPVCPASPLGRPLYSQAKQVDVLPAMRKLRESITSDTKADKHSTQATVTSTTAVGTGGSTAIPVGTTDLPQVDFVLVPSLKMLLVGVAVAAAVFAVYSLVQWIRHRVDGKTSLQVAANTILHNLEQIRGKPDDSRTDLEGGHTSSLGPSRPE